MSGEVPAAGTGSASRPHCRGEAGRAPGDGLPLSVELGPCTDTTDLFTEVPSPGVGRDSRRAGQAKRTQSLQGTASVQLNENDRLATMSPGVCPEAGMFLGPETPRTRRADACLPPEPGDRGPAVFRCTKAPWGGRGHVLHSRLSPPRRPLSKRRVTSEVTSSHS